jgi:hypothetical protein
MRVKTSFWNKAGCLVAVLAVGTMLPGVASATTETQNFDSPPADWVGMDNDTYGPYGYSDTNKTQGDPAGEAGGIFQRTNVRNYYADTDLGGQINSYSEFGATGEVYVYAPFADNDTFVGHFLAPSQGAQGNEYHHGGFMLREYTNSNFRFMARIRGDGAEQYTGEQIVVGIGAYDFSYDFDPSTKQLTAQLYGSGGGALVAESTTPAMEGTFLADAFGLSGGFNGASFNPPTLTAYIDAVTYSSLVTGGGINGDYNDDGTVNAADYTRWRDNLGTNNPLANDAIGGTIGQSHYAQWKDNFTAGSASSTAVPEPTSLAIYLVGFVAMLGMRRHG